METEITKKVYTTPRLVVYGSVEAITQGGSDGDNLDQGFPVATKKSDLTFS
jgi:hypothetical protein